MKAGPPAPSSIVLLLGSYAPSLINFRGPLIADLVASGHRVVAAAPNLDEGTRRLVAALGAEAREVPFSNASLNPVDLLAGYQSVRRLIRETKPTVLIAYTIKPVILGSLAGGGGRVKRVVALVTGLGFSFTGGRELRRLASRVAASILYRVALSKADVALFQNEDDRRLFLKLRLIGSRKRTAIVNGSGIDLARFKLAGAGAPYSFLMIARLLGDKGVREYGWAAARLKATHPHARVALVGYLDPSPDSISQAELDRMVANGVEFLGRLDDVRPAIAACSVYVLPSYREGTPRSVLEAMAMGRAIITTDAPGCRDTVKDGENGILIPPRDAGALYAAMLRFVETPGLAYPMGAASRRLAEDIYDVRKVNADIMRHAGL
ncbi:glycosyltransferase family 4 protein [Sphingosinicella rhizophila]|uniref:Glycosyltransferase family 4 protein n=1 Tax=Sphingosinicella rhizophila TaxID=3050082 RepID=A0ABU3Q678_9SPHN|nr:glycosyltransferase family 4 protein [Sphingosinicella sp. GR2756]MDT9598901.1 glycosyltransferase family 4 protein [Sphingosinicella sp. GR2756]